MSLPWRVAVELGVRSNAISAEAGKSALRELDAHASEDLTVVQVATWAAVSPQAMEDLLLLARGTPDSPPRTTPPTVRETSDAPPTLPLGQGPPPAASTRPVDRARPRFPPRLGPYDLIEELGEGGMGIVYRARNTKLGTPCAVKVLIAGEHASPEEIARFRLEAAAVARMGKHPNIVSVYDLDTEGALAFYAMELVEGTPLSRLLRERKGPFPAHDAARIMEKAARAVHFAHEHGVLHRDLKPDNLMIRADGEPQVMDFGLARDTGSTERRSLKGRPMGTPQYMAPEQARGDVERMDARTDVYGLGAVLYELLTGLMPHPGNQQHAWMHALRGGDVIPPRKLRPEVSRDLETICLKALDADSDQRYSTAQAFAEDLGRFQRGETVLARPVGALGRAVRRVRRNPLVSSLVLGLVVAAATIGGVWWRSWSRERALVDGYLRELSLSGGALVDAALARRQVGDLKASKEYADRLDEPVQELKRLAPGLAEPWYYEGRKERALARLDQAEHAQDEAIARAQRPDASRGSLAILHLALYERGLLRHSRYTTEREKEWTASLRADAGRLSPGSFPSVAQLEAASPELRRLKQAALEDLRIVADCRDDSIDLASRAQVARGLVAVLEGRKEAKDLLEAAQSANPYLEEVYTALGAEAQAREQWDQAVSWYERGHQADRGYLPHVLSLVASLGMASQQALSLGRDARTSIDRGLAILEEAIRADPEQETLWTARAYELFLRGKALARQREDPGPSLDGALEAVQKALQIHPGSPDSTKMIASVHKARGEWASGLGQDPTEEYQKAIDAFGAALAAGTDDAAGERGRAGVEALLAQWQHERGADPSRALDLAVEEFTNALHLDPTNADAMLGLAGIHSLRARLLADQGKDPTEEYSIAQAQMESVLSARPSFPEARYNLGLLHAEWGAWHRDRGEDPTSEYAKSIAEFEAALSLNPQYSEALDDQGTVHKSLGDWIQSQGHDPSKEYEVALASFGRAVVANPLFWEAELNRSLTLRAVGDIKRGRGEDPTELYAKAEASIEKAVSLSHGSARALLERAVLLQSRGHWQLFRKEDPSDVYRGALHDFERASSIDPRLAEAAFGQGRMHEALADLLRARGQDPIAEFSDAEVAYRKAIAIRPGYADAIYNLALVLQTRADWNLAHGKDPCEDYLRAVEGYEGALALDPRLWGAAANEGSVAKALAEWRSEHQQDPSEAYSKAIAAWDKALAIRPDDAEMLFRQGKTFQALGEWRRSKGSTSTKEFELAVELYGRLLKLMPNAWQALLYRGVALSCLGRREEAIADVEAALRISPKQPEAVRLLENLQSKEETGPPGGR